MKNSQFWEQYKAKCAEKGLAPHYESEEEFSKAMTQPSKPYNTDDLVANKEEQMQDNDEFEGMYSLMRQSHGFVEEEYLEDSKKNTKEANVETVKPIVCVCCQEPKSSDAFGTLRNGKLRKICKVCHGKSISKARSKNKETAAVKEIPTVYVDHAAQVMARKNFNEAIKNSSDESKEVGKVAIMELRIFHSALAMAYERGKSEGKSFDDLTIHEIDLPTILDEVLGA